MPHRLGDPLCQRAGGISLDGFPTYAELVATIASVAFLISYGIAIAVLAARAHIKNQRFSFSEIVVALLVAFSGSALSFLVLLLVFRSA